MPRGSLANFRLFLRFNLIWVILAGLLFGPARTLAWPRAWVFIGVLTVGMFASILYLRAGDRGLLAERSKGAFQKGQPLADKIILLAYVFCYYPLFSVTALDVFRFHVLPSPPHWVSLLGMAMFLAGWGIGCWTMKVNQFATTVVRVQKERGHCVVDSGPYRIVRHPMYAAAILVLVGPALWMQSYFAALLELVPIGLLALRCVNEEALLRRELAGYEEYTQRVRYRMIPSVW
jgi:protein-S-isoprenylcysteine O-methyltransferase Ste14